MMRLIIWDLPEEAAFSLRHGQKTAGGTDYIAKTAMGLGVLQRSPPSQDIVAMPPTVQSVFAKTAAVAEYRCKGSDAGCRLQDCRRFKTWLQDRVGVEYRCKDPCARCR